MKLLLFLLLTSVSHAANVATEKPCRIWQEKIDPAVKNSGDISPVDQLSSEEKIHAISCLLALEGGKGQARIGGVTNINVSTMVPRASVEIAALFFIRYIYYGQYEHCSAIALKDRKGKWNTKKSVRQAFASYKKWFDEVRHIGMEKSMELGLDPMDGCANEVRWAGQLEWDHLKLDEPKQPDR